MDNKLTAELIKAKIPNVEALKKEHGELTAIAVEDKIALFKKPTRKVIGMASAHIQSDIMEYLSIIAENCYVAGDRAIIDEDEYFLAIVPQLNALVETKTASLLKL